MDEGGGGAPVSYPTYTLPTVFLTTSESGYHEIGSTISQNLTANAIKNDAGAVSDIAVYRNGSQIANQNSPTGAPTTDLSPQFGYADPNNPNLDYALPHNDSGFVVPEGVTSWKASIDYNAGLPKKDSSGDDDERTPEIRNHNAPQAADSGFESSIHSIEGVYPYFYLTSATQLSDSEIATEIAAGNANKVVADANGNITVPYDNIDPEYLYLAHIATDTTKTKWEDPSDPNNSGSIGNPGDLFDPVTTENVNSPDGFWTGKSFKIYKTDYATHFDNGVEFKNS